MFAKYPIASPREGKASSHAHGKMCSGQQKFALNEVSPGGMLYSLPEESDKGQRSELVLLVSVDLMWTDVCSGNKTVKYSLF